MTRILIFLATLIAATPACSHKQNVVRIEATLDAVARAVDPAYEFAVDSCIVRQTLVVQAVEAKEVTPLVADSQIATLRSRCARVRAAFEIIRRSHDEARRLIEEGKLDLAQKRLDAIAEAWRELKGGTE